MEVVSKEVATKEINSWLDALDYPTKARTDEEVKSWIETICESIQRGDLVFEDEHTIVQKLKHPLADGATREIKYDFRFEVGDYQTKMKNKSPNDAIEWNTAKLSLISSQVPAVFLKFKKYDYSVASKLALFF
jgi:hypothetical protein